MSLDHSASSRQVLSTRERRRLLLVAQRRRLLHDPHAEATADAERRRGSSTAKPGEGRMFVATSTGLYPGGRPRR